MRDRLRVIGELHDQGYRRSLHELLLANRESICYRFPGRASLMQTICIRSPPNKNSLHVVASAVIVYASAGSRHKEE